MSSLEYGVMVDMLCMIVDLFFYIDMFCFAKKWTANIKEYNAYYIVKMCKTSNVDEEYEGINDVTIRAKWIMDGANTLEEAAVKLEQYATYLRSLKADGWELRDGVGDDYGHIFKSD